MARWFSREHAEGPVAKSIEKKTVAGHD